MHGGALLHRWSGAWLQRLSEAAEGEAPPEAEAPARTEAAAEGGVALEVVCECAAQRLLLAGFASAVLHLLEVSCAWDGTQAALRPLPALALRLPAPALAAECTAAGSLCALVPSGVLVFPPSPARGFEQRQAKLLPLGLPLAPPAPAQPADEASEPAD